MNEITWRRGNGGRNLHAVEAPRVLEDSNLGYREALCDKKMWWYTHDLHETQRTRACSKCYRKHPRGLILLP